MSTWADDILWVYQHLHLPHGKLEGTPGATPTRLDWHGWATDPDKPGQKDKFRVEYVPKAEQLKAKATDPDEVPKMEKRPIARLQEMLREAVEESNEVQIQG